LAHLKIFLLILYGYIDISGPFSDIYTMARCIVNLVVIFLDT
jgi:hypothetical protein